VRPIGGLLSPAISPSICHWRLVGFSRRFTPRTFSRVRDQGVVAREDVETVAQLLELVDRHQTILERLRSCRDRLAGLRLHHYLGDVAL
jgi:hypothetical protein